MRRVALLLLFVTLLPSFATAANAMGIDACAALHHAQEEQGPGDCGETCDACACCAGLPTFSLAPVRVLHVTASSLGTMTAEAAGSVPTAPPSDIFHVPRPSCA